LLIAAKNCQGRSIYRQKCPAKIKPRPLMSKHKIPIPDAAASGAGLIVLPQEQDTI
jgi:hypothetical protein